MKQEVTIFLHEQTEEIGNINKISDSIMKQDVTIFLHEQTGEIEKINKISDSIMKQELTLSFVMNKQEKLKK